MWAPRIAHGVVVLVSRGSGMSEIATRPKRGLKPDPALKHWSNPVDYAELVRISGESEPPFHAHDIGNPVLRKEYSKKREALDSAFRELLMDGVVLGSGICQGGDRREVIEPSFWELVEIDHDFDETVGAHLKYEKLEFFGPSAIPLNVRSIPPWLDAQLAAEGGSAFRHESGYRHVWFNGIHYSFGPKQAKIIELLHRAVLDGDAWQHGPTILEQAGSASTKMIEAFKGRKDWTSLIASDQRGMYRLKVDQQGNPTE
jgi:hypothetical protein